MQTFVSSLATKTDTDFYQALKQKPAFGGTLWQKVQEIGKKVLSQAKALPIVYSGGHFAVRATIQFFPVLSLSGRLSFPLNGDSITSWISKQKAETSVLKDISDEKLRCVIGLIEEVGKKMNQSFHFCAHRNTASPISMRSAEVAGEGYLFLDLANLSQRTDEEIEFIVAHELAHLKMRHNLTNTLFQGVIVSAEIAALALLPWSCSIPVLCIARQLIPLAESALHRRQERQADQMGCEVAGSQAAIRFFRGAITYNLTCEDKARYSERGDALNDEDHPPFLERLESALSFSSSSQNIPK